MTRLRVSVGAIARNFSRARAACAARGKGLILVTKVVRSRPELVEALLPLGLEAIADVAPEGLAPWAGRLETLLLKFAPDDAALGRPLSGAVLVSSATQARSLVAAASASSSSLAPPSAVLSCEVGDLRDGVGPGGAGALVAEILAAGLPIAGVSANLGCLAGRLPDGAVYRELLACRAAVSAAVGGRPIYCALGGTVVWEDLVAGRIPDEIDRLRLGEAVFLGNNLSLGRSVPGMERDAFVLRSQVLELREKERCEEGAYGLDAFGRPAAGAVCGPRLRAVLDFGELSASFRHLECLRPGCRLVASTHDLSILEAAEGADLPREGEWVEFRPAYNALAHAMVSPDLRVELAE